MRRITEKEINIIGELFKIYDDRGKVTVDDHARLNLEDVSIVVNEEWVNYLQRIHLIHLNYKCVMICVIHNSDNKNYLVILNISLLTCYYVGSYCCYMRINLKF